MSLAPEKLAWLRLALAEGIGPAIASRLLRRLGDVSRAAAATPRDLAAVAGRTRGAALHAALRRARPEPVWRQAEALAQRVLTPADESWPHERFQALHAPPLALFLRGGLPPPDPPAVAVVGTREAGPYGLRVARQLAEDLARQGLWIVSGLAVGIDGAAHAGALAAGRGGTLAVLGCGLDVAYPIEHLDLKEEIVERGGLLGEHPPGTPPHPGHFPRRNRIVAALSAAVVVVEAPLRSGALLTARHALDMGREVLAVPGPCGVRGHRGSHRLIKRGEAALCEDRTDVLASLGLTDSGGGPAPLEERPLPPAGAPLALWGVIGVEEIVSADELCQRSGLGAETVTTALAVLELEGYVARVPGLGVRRT